MIKTQFLRWSLIFVLAISSCSIEIAQPPLETATSQPDALLLTPIATNSTPGKDQQNAGATPDLPKTQIPVTWANLHLTGKLVYGMGSVENNNYIIRIQVLDLETGEVSIVYTVPINGWIYYVSVSPDSKQLIMSYSPPPGENPAVVQALYIMPLDGSKAPELLFMPRIREDQYIQAEWSQDGKYIYYAHVNYQFPEDPHRRYPLFNIFRMAYPGSEEESIAEAAYWPRLSPDSARLVYIKVDPFSITNELRIADPNGENAQNVVISGSYVPDIKDAPIFSPDGQSIIFSGAVPVPPQAFQPNRFEKLSGIRVAKANGGIPSDWWSVPVSGGEITRLTHIQSSGLYASVSPDKKYIASFSAGGIFVMKPDGLDLTLLVPNLDGFSGTVTWIP
jgi:Tol biopolymer transport system component